VGAISDTVGNKQMIGGDTGVKLCLSGELWVFRLGPEKQGKLKSSENDRISRGILKIHLLSPDVGKSSKEIIS
jgi:hypothetical protein